MIDKAWQDHEESIYRDWWISRYYTINGIDPKSKKKYQRYLNSPAWKSKRDKFLSENPYCSKCGATNDLAVHHVKYTRNHTDKEVLEVLCRACHYAEHFGERGSA